MTGLEETRIAIRREALEFIEQTKAVERETVERQMGVLEEYAKMKLDAKDWHGVRDAVVDLEILSAKLEMLEPESES